MQKVHDALKAAAVLVVLGACTGGSSSSSSSSSTGGSSSSVATSSGSGSSSSRASSAATSSGGPSSRASGSSNPASGTSNASSALVTSSSMGATGGTSSSSSGGPADAGPPFRIEPSNPDVTLGDVVTFTMVVPQGMSADATTWSLQNPNGNYSTVHNTTGATATISMGRLCFEGPMQVRAVLGPTLYTTVVNCHPKRAAPTPDVMDNGPLHRLVRMTDGTLYQQNGNNSAHSELVTPVAGLDGGVMTGVSNKIAACQQGSLAILNDGRVVAIPAHGGGDWRPQFVVGGDGGPPLGNAVNVFCGEYSSTKFVELDGGFLFGWGQNDKYQLGLGDNVERVYPTFVPRPGSLEGPLKDMAITSENTLAWRDAQANQLAIWGSNGPNLHLAFPDGGPLFDSGYPPGVYAQPVSFPTAHPEIQAIAAGDLALFITGTNGLVYAWGRDTNVAMWFPQGRYPWGVPYQITLTSPDAGAQLNLTDVARAEPGAAYYWEFIPNTNNFSAALSNTGQIYTWGYMGSVGTGLGWVPKPPQNAAYPIPGLVAVPPARAMDIFGGTGMSISQNTNDIWLWGDLTGGGAWLDQPFQMGIYGCGNGVLEAGEQCDDNNWTASIQDGCGTNSAGVIDGRICRVGFFAAETANSATSPQVITLPPGATTRGVNGTLTTVATENDFFRATVGPNQVLSAQLLDGCHDGVKPTYAVLSPGEQPLTSCAVGQLNCRLDCSPINIPNPAAGDWTFQVFGSGPGTNHTYRMVVTIRNKGFGDP